MAARTLNRSEKLGQVSAKTIIYLILIGFAIVEGYPLLWLAFNAFKSDAEIFTNIWGLPQSPSLEAFASAWDKANIGTYYKNTLIVTIGTVLLVLLIGSLASYVFARMRFPGSELIFIAVLLTMMIQPAYTLVALFRIIRDLGLLKIPYLGLILPYTAGSLPLTIALFTPYFRSIPVELEEAARIDGAGWFKIFTRVVLPLSGPVISAVVIFTFLGAYNELLLSLIVIRTEEFRTLPLGLSTLMGRYDRNYGELFAGLTMAIVPAALVYLVFQRRFISGITAGAVRG
jgi:ABC-type glycerol-3-phosphate transport system permease component